MNTLKNNRPLNINEGGKAKISTKYILRYKDSIRKPKSINHVDGTHSRWMKGKIKYIKVQAN